MNKLDLYDDEIIIAQESNVKYFGDFNVSCFDTVILTDTRIICVEKKFFKRNTFEISLKSIRCSNGKALVDVFKYSKKKECLRVQCESGVHSFFLKDDPSFWVEEIKDCIETEPEVEEESNFEIGGSNGGRVSTSLVVLIILFFCVGVFSAPAFLIMSGAHKYESENETSIKNDSSSKRDSSNRSEEEILSPSMDYNLKNAYYNGTNKTGNSYDSPYGIGRSINVLTDSYINVSGAYEKVFDDEKILSCNWIKTNVSEFGTSTYSGESMIDFYDYFQTDYSKKSSVGINIPAIFSVGFEKSFSVSTNTKISSRVQEIYSKLTQNVTGFKIEIEGYKNYKKFRNYLSESFLDEVSKANINSNDDLDDLLNSYGSHVLLAGYYGGRIECNYHYLFKKSSLDNTSGISYSNKATAALGTVVDLASTSSGISFDISNEISLNGTAIEEEFNFVGKGGPAFAASNLNEFMIGYKNWVDSFNTNKNDYNILIDLPEQSMVAIWDLLSEDYQDLADKLKDRFLEKASQKEHEFLAQYEREVDEEWDPIDITQNTHSNFQKLCVTDNTGYDPGKLDSTVENVELLDMFDVGNIRLYGCTKVGSSSYKIVDRDEFRLRFKVVDDITNLPFSGNSKRKKVSLASDTWNKKVIGTGLNGTTIGYGGIWIRLTDINENQKDFTLYNFLANALVGEYINLVDSTSISDLAKIDSIEITYIWEIKQTFTDLIGISYDKTPNYRHDVKLSLN